MSEAAEQRAARAADPRWAAWRVAETAIGRPRAVERAAEKLPPRQGLILCALDALERADRVALEQVAEQAASRGDQDIAHTLVIALRDPDGIDPTDLRQDAKRSGVRNAPGLPRLDFLRLLAVALGGHPPTRPPALAREGYERAVLDAALMALSRKFTAYRVEQDLERRSPRLAAFWCVALARTHGRDPRRDLSRMLPRATHRFPAAEWPDLDEPLARTGLAAWLAESPPGPWKASFEADLSRLVKADPGTQRAALGALLARIGELLRAGAPAAVIPVLAAASSFLDRARKLPRRDELLLQLAHVQSRLLWLAGGPRDPGLAASLWDATRAESREARRVVARAILEQGACAERLPPEALAEVLVELSFGGETAEERFGWWVESGRHVPRPALAAALAASGLGARERLILEAEHACATHDRPRALDLVRRLLTEEAMAPGAAQTVAIAMTLTLVGSPRLGRRERRTFEAILDYAAGHTPGIALAGNLVMLLPNVFPPAQAAAWRERLRPAVLRRLERPPLTEELPLEALVLHRLGDTERAQERFLLFGRALRKGAGEPSTWHLALRALNLLAPDPDDAEDFPDELDLAEEAEEEVDPVLAGWLEALRSFLLHRGPDHLARQVESLPRERFMPSPGLRRWVDEHYEELGEHEVWDELVGLDLLDELGIDIDPDELDLGALAGSPLVDPRFDPSKVSFEELRELVQQAMGAATRGRRRGR